MGEKCEYLAKKVNIWPKKSRFGQKCKFLTKLGRFMAKNPIIFGRKQKFWYTLNGKNTWVPYLHCFFSQATDQMGKKCWNLAKNASFGHNLAIFWPNAHLFEEGSKIFATLITGNQWDTCFVLKTLTVEAPIGRWGRKSEIWIFGAKSHFFVLESEGISPVNQGPQLSYLDHPGKFSVSELWIILAISGHSHFASTLNLRPWSTKHLGDRVGHKKMTHNDNGPGPGRNYGETAIFTFGRKVFFWPKIRFF